MRKHRSGTLIRIVNPEPGGKWSTSRAWAEDHVRRGRAVFVSENAIRLVEEARVRQERSVRAVMESDRKFWDDVARERGGAELLYQWRPMKVRTGEERKLGYTVMGTESRIAPENTP